MTAIDAFLACPRCDKLLTPVEDNFRCKACDVDFRSLNGIPFLFSDPEFALGEWRSRLNMALTQQGNEISRIEEELKDKDLRLLTRRRLERYKKALDYHRRALMKLLKPVDVQATSANHETYLALRTRLPIDQGLNTYYANIHRDWAWGDEENQAAMNQVRAVTQQNADLGNTLVLGAGAARLAYDIHMQLAGATTTALDFNPLLLLAAQEVVSGGRLSLHEFPIAPRSADDEAILRTLIAPEPVREGFELVLADALRPPFAPGSFDTVITPWLIDVIDEELPVLAARINALLKDNGRWVNFGSLAYATPGRAGRLSPDEAREIVGESGFSDPYVSEATIPYMSSPASRHGRQERVFTFSAWKQREAQKVERHRALPDWIVVGKDPVPLASAFRTQAMTTQIYSYVMSLIDGKRSIEDMADVMESQRLMTRDEAVPAIRSFLIKMVDDANRTRGF